MLSRELGDTVVAPPETLTKNQFDAAQKLTRLNLAMVTVCLR
jgi:hypothetical protein